MPDRLSLTSLSVEGGCALLGFAVATPVSLGEARKVGDLDGGATEHEQVIEAGDGRFVLRVVADADGAVRAAIAATGEVPEGWYRRLGPIEESGT